MNNFIVSMKDLRWRLTEIIGWVRPGQRVVVEKHGSPVAILVDPGEFPGTDELEMIKRRPLEESTRVLTDWCINYGIKPEEAARFSELAHAFGWRRLVPNTVGWKPGTGPDGEPLPTP